MLEGFLDKIVELSANESAEECTGCTEEVGGKENTLSRLDTMPLVVSFSLSFGFGKQLLKPFHVLGIIWKGMHWRNCFLRHLSMGLNWVLRLYRRK